MLSNSALVANRRHLARIGVRLGALMCLVRVLVVIEGLIQGYSAFIVAQIAQRILEWSGVLLLWVLWGLALVVFERPLVRWLVPALPAGCPSCGYAITSANAGTCPECGTKVDQSPPSSP